MAIRKNEQWVTEHLRKSIVNSDFRPGERINETLIATHFGVSRTPARAALRAVEAEGLVSKRDGRGYTVAEIQESSLREVISLRGVLEGLAARTLAEAGLSQKTTERLKTSLAASGQVARSETLTPQLLETFRYANAIFHETLICDCENSALIYAHDRLKVLPFYALNAYAPKTPTGDPSLLHLKVSHAQHAIVFRSIEEGDGARAEALMREHCNATLDYAEILSQN